MDVCHCSKFWVPTLLLSSRLFSFLLVESDTRYQLGQWDSFTLLQQGNHSRGEERGKMWKREVWRSKENRRIRRCFFKANAFSAKEGGERCSSSDMKQMSVVTLAQIRLRWLIKNAGISLWNLCSGENTATKQLKGWNFSRRHLQSLFLVLHKWTQLLWLFHS